MFVQQGCDPRVEPLLQQSRVDAGGHEVLVGEDAQQQAGVRGDAVQPHPSQAGAEHAQGGIAVGSVGDELREHGVVMDADDRSRLDTGVDPEAVRGRIGEARALDVEGSHGAGLGSPVVGRVLGVEAHLDGVAAGCRYLAVELVALGDRQLQRHQVEAGDALGDRVLDLQARVHLQEVHTAGVLVSVGDEELDGAGADVADGLAGGPGGVVELLAHGIADGRRGCLLDDLLVTALDRAVAVSDDPHGAVGVGHDLHLDVAGGRQVRLDEHGVVAERRQRLGAGGGELAGEVGRVGDHPHAASTAASGCLHQEWEVVLRCRVRIDGQHRYAGLDHQLLGADLRTHRLDGLRRGSDPGEAGVHHLTGEVGVLGQEAVAGMDGVCAGALRGVDDEVGAQVGVGRRAAGQADRPVGLGDERCVRVGVGEHRDGGDAEFAAGAEHPARDLAAVGDQHRADHLDSSWLRYAARSSRLLNHRWLSSGGRPRPTRIEITSSLLTV